MRSSMMGIAAGLIGWSSAIAQVPDDLVTAPNAILCLSPDNLDIANHPIVAESQLVLRGMGCLRTEAGIRTRRLEGADTDPDRPLRVRFYPRGISGGVVLWGLTSSFAAPDGAKLLPVKRAGS
jgi:hypothetical protein